MNSFNKQILLFFALLICSTATIIAQESQEMNIIKQTLLDNNKKLTAPVADKVAHEIAIHGDVRTDDYFWMRLTDEQKNAKTPDAATQKVLDYLEAENSYQKDMMAHTDDFQEKLFNEIVGRIKQTDESVPYKSNGYYYITKYEEGKEYPIYTRKKGTMEADSELLFDVNAMAEGYEYYQLNGRNVTPDNKIIAYGEDTLSRRIYTIRFKNLETGELYDDVIDQTNGYVVWANDNKTCFYTRKDEALRSYKIFRHTLGTPSSEDLEVFHETDETFGTYVYKTKSKQFIVIGSYSTLSNEYRYVSADDPEGDFRVFQKRERNLEHSIAHYKDHWYITTNKDDAINFKLMKCPVGQVGKENWEEMIPHRKEVLLSGVELFSDFMVLSERKDGITQIRIRSWDGKDDHYIDFGESSYLAYTSINPDFETDKVRVGYTSMTTPNSSYDYYIADKKLDLLKQQEVIGDFDKNNYVSERVYATATDGTQIPISIVYKKGYEKNGKAPLLLYGYGSYGNSMEPYFSSVRLSLLDRGFAYAIAHIRGGQEMGRQWYEDGKLLKKKNTFTDFIDCGKHLVNQQYTSPEHMYALGGSAGGLLMGAIINIEPKLWNGVIAAVPFVDVVSTMLDETIPLTTGEFDEWGNPKDKTYYDYIKSYSPYDQIKNQDYPNLLITTGYFDSQVQYWEPAKWIAKLRTHKTDQNVLMMYCNMGAGHGGASGRFRRYRETAMEYAFMLALEGIDQ